MIKKDVAKQVLVTSEGIAKLQMSNIISSTFTHSQMIINIQ